MRRRSALGAWAVRLVVGTLVMAVVLVCGTALRVWQVARDDDRTPADALLVLGAAQYDGTPSAVFAARLEHARALYAEGVAPLVITVGGKQPGDEFTEAASGRRYLVDAGVPASAIAAVEDGADTLGSIKAVAELMRADNLSRVVVVSDPWHSARTLAMAENEGLHAQSSPTRQGPSVLTRESQFQGIMRETGALLYYRLTDAPTTLFETTANW
ncbi:YdcF family protein [Rhodococcus sp. X156]|uniref:YdcF family protein n=1 Tax=Rhodococcus sp. X156 TaxID=2499145 RepID=UPI000FDB2327|nr:YdcF family protein [Rhodococcus sp. X156]